MCHLILLLISKILSSEPLCYPKPILSSSNNDLVHYRTVLLLPTPSFYAIHFINVWAKCLLSFSQDCSLLYGSLAMEALLIGVHCKKRYINVDIQYNIKFWHLYRRLRNHQFPSQTGSMSQVLNHMADVGLVWRTGLKSVLNFLTVTLSRDAKCARACCVCQTYVRMESNSAVQLSYETIKFCSFVALLPLCLATVVFHNINVWQSQSILHIHVPCYTVSCLMFICIDFFESGTFLCFKIQMSRAYFKESLQLHREERNFWSLENVSSSSNFWRPFF